MRFCASRLLSSCVNGRTRGIRNGLCVESRKEPTYRCSCHTADDEVAAASKNRFRHDAVMRCVFGPRGEASCFLCDYDPCLYPPKNFTMSCVWIHPEKITTNANIPRPYDLRGCTRSLQSSPCADDIKEDTPASDLPTTTIARDHHQQKSQSAE
jgi:hypothetical protein